MEFEKQSEMMDMKEEMMNDAIDDAMGDEEDEDARLETTNAFPKQIFFKRAEGNTEKSPLCCTDAIWWK